MLSFDNLRGNDDNINARFHCLSPEEILVPEATTPS